MSSGCSNWTDNAMLSEEIEALRSIYVRELEVNHSAGRSGGRYPTSIQLTVNPSTADNAQEQYVFLTLVINIPSNYPDELPEFLVRNPRGLSDDDLEQIYRKLGEKARSNRGNQMLYLLIEVVKEHLTTGNTPRGLCAICLFGFCEEDAFVKTECYHYFHSHCIKRYVDHEAGEADHDSVLNKVRCPVCRERIACSAVAADARPPVYSEAADSVDVNPLVQRMQQLMATLYVYQKSKGGIIDVEADKNKFLIEISSTPRGENDGGAPANLSQVDRRRQQDQHRGGRKPLRTFPGNSRGRAPPPHGGLVVPDAVRLGTSRDDGGGGRRKSPRTRGFVAGRGSRVLARKTEAAPPAQSAAEDDPRGAFEDALCSRTRLAGTDRGRRGAFRRGPRRPPPPRSPAEESVPNGLPTARSLPSHVAGFAECRQRIVLTGPPPSKSFNNGSGAPLPLGLPGGP